MRQINNRREGMALAVAVFAIVIIGAIVGGAFFASNQEYRIGSNSLQQAKALSAAEYGQIRMLSGSDWPQGAITNMAAGGMITREYVVDSNVVDTVRVTKLTERTFLVTSEAFVGKPGASQTRRRTSTMARLNIPQLNILAALTTRGSAKIGGSSFISGYDTTYTGWECPAPGAPMPGIAIADASQITTSGCNNLNCVDGVPKISEDPRAAQDSTYFEYGGIDWAELISMANKRYLNSGTINGLGPSYNPDGTCDQRQDNWGDPSRNLVLPGACENYFPIIYADGNMHISGGKGQGILLVEGDLDVSGGAQFFGPVIVKGRLKTTGTGGHFNGGVMAANVDLEQNVVLGNAVISFSRCALMKALAGASPPTLVKQRAWAELY